jgi:bifunctional non-homologous end joining protein LigD
MTPTIIHSTTLHFREGRSDKVYQATIEEAPGNGDANGYNVTVAYGRRGATLKTGTKTQQPVSREKAVTIHDKLVASKQAKGYRISAEPGTTYHQAPEDGRDTGIRPQLLNPVDESEVPRLLTDTRHCLQEKHDGRRLMVRKQGDRITGINRRGLVVALPEPIRLAVSEFPCDVLLDGEAVGDTLHVFDLLEAEGTDLRPHRYIDRHSSLLRLLPLAHPALTWVSAAIDPDNKVETYEELRLTGAEGVVFKDINAPYTPGRPNSGGPQLKFKFVETASFIVGPANPGRRSVALELVDGGGRRVPAGNVTIPSNHGIPQMGTVVEVRYLYAHRESGAIYQPVYLGPRDDIPAEECTVDQLKFKPETATA